MRGSVNTSDPGGREWKAETYQPDPKKDAMSETVRENSTAGSHPAQPAAVNRFSSCHQPRIFGGGAVLPWELRQKAVSG